MRSVGGVMPAKPQDIVGDDGLGRPEDRIAERHVDAEGVSVRFPCEPTFCAEAQALVLHALVLDLGMLRIRADLEGRELLVHRTGAWPRDWLWTSYPPSAAPMT